MKAEGVVQILNRARAEELACIRLYGKNAILLEEQGNAVLARMFRDQLEEELEHARWLAERIQYLGGLPTHKPAPWYLRRSRRHKLPQVRRILQEAAALERREAALYSQAILDCAMDGDLPTKALLERIADNEEFHQGQWVGLLARRD